MIADAIFKVGTLALASWTVTRTVWAWNRIHIPIQRGVRTVLLLLTVPAVMRFTYTIWRLTETGFLDSVHFTAWISRMIDLISLLIIVTVQAIIIDVKVNYLKGDQP